MAPTTTTVFWTGLLATASILSQLTLAASPSSLLEKRQPRVLGFDFDKTTSVLTPARNAAKLRKRQTVVQAALDNDEIAYTINITIGTPPQSFIVQIDTGSADLWVPSSSSDACLDPSDPCAQTGGYNVPQSSSATVVGRDNFQISYEDNSGVTGDYVNDTVSIGSTTIKSLTMGVGTSVSRALGIMGIGFDADESIAVSDPSAVYPNIVQTMKDDGLIDTVSYSLWLNDLYSPTGSILFGGVDTAKYVAPLIALPIQPGVNASIQDITVDLTGFSLIDAAGKQAYNQGNLNLPVILDSGTTDTYMPDDIANDIISGVGAVNDAELGLIVPCQLAVSPAKFAFAFGGNGGPIINVAFSEFVTPIFLDDGSQPRFRDGSGAACSFGLMSSGDASQPILLGDTFLRSAYVVYDLQNKQVGLANTKFNVTESNIQEIASDSIPGVTATATASAASQVYTGHPLQTHATRLGHNGFNGGAKSPTFNLGSAATSKSAAVMDLAPPGRMEIMIMTSLVAMGMSVLVGGGIVAFGSL